MMTYAQNGGFLSELWISEHVRSTAWHPLDHGYRAHFPLPARYPAKNGPNSLLVGR